MSRSAIALLLITTGASAATLEDIRTRPETCQALLTVQKRGCQVETTYECTVGGHIFRRVESFDADGPESVAHEALNYDLIQYSDLRSFSHFVGLESTAQFPSLEEMLRTGNGSGRQKFELHMFGQTRIGATDVTIHLTDPNYFIGNDVVQRFEGEFKVVFPEPMPTFSGTAFNYYDPVSKLLIEGEVRFDVLDNDTDEKQSKPARLVRPGEAGFQSSTPDYDCEAISSITPETRGSSA